MTQNRTVRNARDGEGEKRVMRERKKVVERKERKVKEERREEEKW